MLPLGKCAYDVRMWREKDLRGDLGTEAGVVLCEGMEDVEGRKVNRRSGWTLVVTKSANHGITSYRHNYTGIVDTVYINLSAARYIRLRMLGLWFGELQWKFDCEPSVLDDLLSGGVGWSDWRRRYGSIVEALRMNCT